MKNKYVSRREFLRVSGLTAAGLLADIHVARRVERVVVAAETRAVCPCQDDRVAARGGRSPDLRRELDPVPHLHIVRLHDGSHRDSAHHHQKDHNI